jgi:hypothetical protein
VNAEPNILPASFSALDETLRADLIAWFNTHNPEAEDYERLAELARAGRFAAWACPSCDDRVFEASPDEWEDFQGVCQTDRVSYPGKGPVDPRCDHCRCYNVESRKVSP